MNIPDFKLIRFRKGDFKKEIAEACMNQAGAKKAQLRIVVTSVLKRLKADSDNGAKLWACLRQGQPGRTHI